MGAHDLTSSDYLAADAVKLAAMVRAGEVSPSELRAAATARYHHTDAAINAVVEWYDSPDAPRPAGALADAPLAGVPFLRKDIGSTEAGRLVEMGSRLAAGNRASSTSPYFARMLAAGVQVLGRTTVPEFAQHATTESVVCGPTRNPLNPTTSAGGSSGGAAAAVRAGVVPLAHASDAAGSIRIPSAVTGLIGLKPTRGLTAPPPDRWRGLLVEFVVARSVADVEATLALLSSASGGVPIQACALRVGLSLDHWAGFANDPTVTKAVEGAARQLQSRGYEVEPIARPFDYDRLMSTWPALFDGGIADMAELAAAASGRPLDGEHLEPMTLNLLADVRASSPTDRAAKVAAANTAAQGVTAELTTNLAGFDLLLTPTLDRAVIPLKRMGGFTPRDQYMRDGDEWFDRLYLANVTGWPAISVPANPEVGVGDAPPIGLQFMAPPGGESLLLAVARDLLGDRIIEVAVSEDGNGRPVGN